MYHYLYIWYLRSERELALLLNNGDRAQSIGHHMAAYASQKRPANPQPERYASAAGNLMFKLKKKTMEHSQLIWTCRWSANSVCPT